MRNMIHNAFNQDIDNFDTVTFDRLKIELAKEHSQDDMELDLKARYEEAFLTRFTYESNALDGSNLNLMETDCVLDGSYKPTENTRLRDMLAARGIADGCFYASKSLANGVALSQELIKGIHERTAIDGPFDIRGTYRVVDVCIKGSAVDLASAHEISGLMDALISTCESSAAHPVAKAAAFHVVFERIHPFRDGNGRTGRIVLNYMLEQAGYPPIAIKHNDKINYKKALEQWQTRGDSSAFLALVSQEVKEESLVRINMRVLTGNSSTKTGELSL